MLKVISYHTKNVKLCENVELCKPVLPVLLFHMLSAWIKQQIVDIIMQGAS